MPLYNSGAGTMYSSSSQATTSIMSGRGLPMLAKDEEEPQTERPQEAKKTPSPARTASLNASRATALARASARNQTNGQDDADGLWPPNGVAKADRCKANVIWILLLCGATAYLVGLCIDARDRRSNPPIKIEQKVEPYSFPDVAFCPSAGDGCDSSNPEDCAEGMRLFVPALAGFVESAAEFAETLLDSTASSPTLTPASSSAFSALASLTTSQLPLDTSVHSWCPVIPFSALTIDSEGVDSGDVRSLHASVYILWSDEVAATPMSSTRQFINTFLVDQEGEVEGTVLSRLPYDRVDINASAPTTFSSNDVTVGLTQYVSLTSAGKTGTTERSYTQTTTTGRHTVSFEGLDTFAGALLYATFSIDGFEYQSTEEVDPVDMWILLGAAGGILVLARALFALFFVPSRKPGVGKVWRFSQKRKRRRSKLDFRQDLPVAEGSPIA